MNKEFVPYQESLALKELGFDEPCFGYWNIDPQIKTPYFNMVKPFEHDWCLPAPLYQQAFRWFREKYKLIGLVQRDITRNYNGWWFKILSQIEEKDNPILLYSEDFNKDTYEEAELACLKKLIEIVKNE
jgi:hypothetical protein